MNFIVLSKLGVVVFLVWTMLVLELGAEEKTNSLIPRLPEKGMPEFEHPPTDWKIRHNNFRYSPDGRMLATARTDGSIGVWDSNSGKRIFYQEKVWKTPFVVNFTLDGKEIFSAGDSGEIAFWNLKSGEKIRTLKGHKGSIFCCEVFPDRGWMLSGGEDGNIVVWDVKTWKQVSLLLGSGGYITAIRILPRSGLLLSGGFRAKSVFTAQKQYSGANSDYVRVWNLNTQKIIETLPIEGTHISLLPNGYQVLHGSWGMDVRRDADGVSVGSYNSVGIWDLQLGAEIRVWNDRGWEVGISPDGRWIGSCSGDCKYNIRGWPEHAGGQQSLQYGICLTEPETGIDFLRSKRNSGIRTIVFGKQNDRLAYPLVDSQTYIESPIQQLFTPELDPYCPMEFDKAWRALACREFAPRDGQDSVLPSISDLRLAYWSLITEGDKSVKKIETMLVGGVILNSKKPRKSELITNSEDFFDAKKIYIEAGWEAVPILREIIEAHHDVKVKKLARDLLLQKFQQGMSSDEVQALRGVRILKSIGTTKAMAALVNLRKQTSNLYFLNEIDTLLKKQL